MRKIIHVDTLPDLRKAGLSHAVETDDYVFAASMALSHDLPRRRDPAAVTVADETRIAIQRLEERLKVGGCTLQDVVKMTCYLSDKAHNAEFREVYNSYWEEGNHPVRLTLVVGLALDCRIELDAIAVKPKN
jgi:2-iminobutanoate/2-iminopropanoate deaminase